MKKKVALSGALLAVIWIGIVVFINKFQSKDTGEQPSLFTANEIKNNEQDIDLTLNPIENENYNNADENESQKQVETGPLVTKHVNAGFDVNASSVADTSKPENVVWHDTTYEAFSTVKYSGCYITYAYKSLKDIVENSDGDNNLYAVTISFNVPIETYVESAKSLFTYQGKTYEEIVLAFQGNPYVVRYNEEYKKFCETVYPTLPDSYEKEKQGEQGMFDIEWQENHDKDTVQGYKKAVEDYDVFRNAFYEWSREEADKYKESVYKKQEAILEGLGMYIAKSSGSFCQVYATVDEMRALAATEECGYSLSWTRKDR